MIACGLALAWMLQTAPADDPAQRAAAAYQDGRFEQAFAGFAALLARQDADRGALAFNMGACALRLGRDAEAIWYFHRALHASPGDRAARQQLRRAQLRLGVDPGADTRWRGIADRVDRLSPPAAALLIAIGQGLGLVGLVRLQRPGARGAALLVLVAALGVAGRVARVHLFPQRLAVVLRDGVWLRSAPHADVPGVRELRPGEAVRVLARSDHWMHISMAGGAERGYVASADLGVVE